jgi:hypothetical protein
MINIKCRICIFNKCDKQPIFNYEGVKSGLYCSEHKLDKMVNVTDVRCIFPECMTLPSYNLIDDPKPKYCFKHKSEEMVDVKSKKCITKGCLTLPSCNVIGETKRLYCNKHKLEGMIDVSSRICMVDGCKTNPSYNYNGMQRLYCSKHKLDGMIDVINTSKICKTDLCTTRVNNKYDGYCVFCYINLFPDKPVASNYKTKERAVVDYVLEHFQHYSWKTDKVIKDGCSRRRPDLLLDLGYQVLIIEVDENQHMDYDCSCENKRIMELSQDIGHRPIVFIRFNPDAYYDEHNVKIKSCWSINGKGICAVNKANSIKWSDRLAVLQNQINYWIDRVNKTDKIVEVVQLFYDQPTF